ncbi:unnamed protein product [Paramecium pentaurelia]|uniref:LisH domain-containing protein n=1 Tax=Paramecium pentaurelia TaxID=43138 RepID=A0A8S1WKM7_9CILI|nr:unnamed protein product [Paramecium pentaurelia]
MIVIKTEELNYLIYTYFLEQGYSHSAFALINEVKIDQLIYRDDVKPGQLINLLEKALLFQQLQDHIQINQYYECKVPQLLIQKHVCQFTEKKQLAEKQERRDREIMIQNALMRSQEFASRNGQTMDLNIELQQDIIQLQDEILLSDWNAQKNILAIYQLNCIKFIQNNQIIQIMPTVVGESFSRVKLMKFDRSSGNNMLIVYENGAAKVIDTTIQIIKMFNIKNSSKLLDFHWNLNWPNVVALIFEKDIEIVDIYKCQTLKYLENVIHFEWRHFDHFIVMDYNYYINLMQIDIDKPQLQLKAELETTLIEFNKRKTLLASFSSTLNIIKIWTLQNDDYVFEITDDQKILQFCWCSSQNANYLITLTSQTLNIWDVEFGQIKSTYEIDFNVINMVSMDLLNDTPQVVLIGEKVVLYDLINKKRRVFNCDTPNKVLRINDEEILFIFRSSYIVYKKN